MKTLLLLGATGMTGRALLQRALADPRIGRVVAPTRTPLPAHPRLANPQPDFTDLQDADWWHADVLVSALGTTLRQAGSPAAFERIDHDLVLAMARKARDAGTPAMVVISSRGADARARSLYLRTKGRLENHLAGLGFDALTVLRPALLDTPPRKDARPAERMALALIKPLAPLLPAGWRPVNCADLTDLALEAACRTVSGHTILFPGTHETHRWQESL